jgi:5-methylcytosine-specific restriction endonuclease McrA
MKVTAGQREHKKQVEIFQKAEKELDRVLGRSKNEREINVTRFASCGNCAKILINVGNRWSCPNKCKQKEYYLRSKKPLTREQLIRNKWGGIKSRALRKGVPFTITIEDIVEICQNKTCYYCKSPATPELDRKVPKLGYVRDNLVPSCGVCNIVKNNILTHEEMIQLSEITKHHPLGVRR